MCLTNETIDELHAITSAIKTVQEHRGDWLKSYDVETGGDAGFELKLPVTRAEAERIFSDRIAAHQSRLKEIGWSRTVRVETQPQGDTK